jgi:hypothetical protein
MDSVCADATTTTLTNNSTEANGIAMDHNNTEEVAAAVEAPAPEAAAPEASTSSAASGAETAASAGAPATYDDLFPSLPLSAPGANTSKANPIGEWNRKPMLLSSTVTQVFHIPTEERKDAAASGNFGGEE